MTWIPQPESGPDTLPAGATVAGVRVCRYHADTSPGLRHAHGSAQGLTERVAQIASQCLDCRREQSEATP